MIDFFKKYLSNEASKYINPFLFILATIVSISPVIHFYSPIKGNVISVLALLFLLIPNAKYIANKCRIIIFIFSSILLSGASAIYWGEAKYLLLQTYFILSVLTLFCLNDSDLKKTIHYLTVIFLILLLGAFVGYFYAYFQGSPIIEITNPDGRKNSLFLSTFTNSIFGNVIRPSGIFDEPGALSFLLCILVCMRELFKLNRKISWLLLFMGLITSSIAHLIFCFFYLIHSSQTIKFSKKIILNTCLIGIAFLTMLYFIPPIHSLLHDFYLSRFNSSLGQDRIATTLNAISYLNVSSFFWGLDSSCALGSGLCWFMRFSNYGDNPLSLLIHWGFLISWPYYLSLIYSFWRGAVKKDFYIFGLFLLLLQRPYIISYGYSLLLVFALYYPFKQNFLNSRR
jgi:hypothetical protein